MVLDVMEWSFQVFRRHPATIPPRVPKMAENTADVPTRATVAGIRETISSDLVAAPVGHPHVQREGLLQIEEELGPERLVQPELGAQPVDHLVGDLPTPEHVGQRVGLHHPEQEEVDAEHEEERQDRTDQAAQDEPAPPALL